MQFNIRHLLSALEVKRFGTISKASRHICLTQSAITQGINKLESQLQHKLFDRTTSGMFVTPPGQLFLDRLTRAFGFLESIANAIFDTDRNKRHAFIRNVTYRQLKTLIVLVELRSYTTAGIRLGLTQPTLSKTIKDLEALCEQRLFYRSPSGVEPTWQARQMTRLASLFFSEINQGQVELNDYAGKQSGTILIGCLPLARTTIIPNTVLTLLEEYPDVHVSIIDGPYDEQLNALLHGELDFIVGALRYPPTSEDIEQIKLFDDSLSIVARAAHPRQDWLVKPELTQELSEFQWIGPRQGTPARNAFGKLFAERCLPDPEDVIECSSLVAIRGLLLNSDRLALLPARQVELEVQSGLLAASPALPDTSRKIGYTRRKNWKPTRIQENYLRLLKQFCGQSHPMPD